MAITVVVTTNTITVNATDVGGNTIDEIYVAVAASAHPEYMVRTGAGPYTYSLPAETYLNINGGYIKDTTVGGGTIQWTSRSASSSTTLRVQSAAKLELGPDWVIDFSNNLTYYTYVYLYGQIIFQGTSGHEVILKHYYVLAMYNYLPNGANAGPNDWDYVKCLDMAYSTGGYWIQFDAGQQASRPTHSFKNCTFQDTLGNGRGQMYFNGQGDFTGIELDSLTFDACNRAFASYGASMKFSNCTFQNIVSYPFYIDGSGAGVNSYKKGSDTSSYNVTCMQQPKVTFDTCLFRDNYAANEYAAGYVAGGVVKYKNCTCDELGSPPSVYGFMSYYLAALLYEGTQTLTNVTNKYYIGGGGHFQVKTLTLNVIDSEGSPVSGAVVMLKEANGYNGLGETMITRADGYIKDLFGDNPVLVYREITDAAGTTFTNWGTYTVLVTADGQGQYQTTLDMSSDQTVTIQLPAEDTNTVIYGSTLYGSTIY